MFHTYWLTGLSGAGKTTIANGVQERYQHHTNSTRTLDGDTLRNGLCMGLGYSWEDRFENIRRAAHVARAMNSCGKIVLASFILPDEIMRTAVKQITRAKIIYIDCNLEECERRDVKGLYVKARKGEIKEFTGISSPYEQPVNPDLVLHTDRDSINACVRRLYRYIMRKG